MSSQQLIGASSNWKGCDKMKREQLNGLTPPCRLRSNLEEACRMTKVKLIIAYHYLKDGNLFVKKLFADGECLATLQWAFFFKYSTENKYLIFYECLVDIILYLSMHVTRELVICQKSHRKESIYWENMRIFVSHTSDWHVSFLLIYTIY